MVVVAASCSGSLPLVGMVVLVSGSGSEMMLVGVVVMVVMVVVAASTDGQTWRIIEMFLTLKKHIHDVIGKNILRTFQPQNNKNIKNIEPQLGKRTFL